MIRAVLIDDEPQSCKSLAIKLKTVATDIEIVGTFHLPIKALEQIHQLRPQVVFLDIEMPELNGFQLLEQIDEFDFEVIFITAYSEYMLHALHLSALDYLLKPVDVEELKQALLRLRKKLNSTQNFLEKKTQLEIASHSLNEVHTPKRLAVNTLQGIIFLRIAEIIKVEALSNYSSFFMSNHSKIMVSKTLKEFEATLTAHNFFRANRSCLVNTDYILKYKHEDGGVLELLDGSEIPVGPHRKNELVALLSRL